MCEFFPQPQPQGQNQKEGATNIPTGAGMVVTRLRASDGLFVWVFIMVLHEHHEGAYRYTDSQKVQNDTERK